MTKLDKSEALRLIPDALHNERIFIPLSGKLPVTTDRVADPTHHKGFRPRHVKNKPESYLTLDGVLNYLESNNVIDGGIGIIPTKLSDGSHVVILDGDNVLDNDGELTDAAAEVCEAGNGFAKFKSASGYGVHQLGIITSDNFALKGAKIVLSEAGDHPDHKEPAIEFMTSTISSDGTRAISADHVRLSLEPLSIDGETDLELDVAECTRYWDALVREHELDGTKVAADVNSDGSYTYDKVTREASELVTIKVKDLLIKVNRALSVKEAAAKDLKAEIDSQPLPTSSRNVESFKFTQKIFRMFREHLGTEACADACRAWINQLVGDTFPQEEADNIISKAIASRDSGTVVYTEVENTAFGWTALAESGQVSTVSPIDGKTILMPVVGATPQEAAELAYDEWTTDEPEYEETGNYTIDRLTIRKSNPTFEDDFFKRNCGKDVQQFSTFCENVEPLRPIIDGVFYEKQPAIAGGGSKSGKTTLVACEMGLACATGVPWLGQERFRPHSIAPTLVLSGESAPSILKTTFQSQLDFHGLAESDPLLKDFHIWTHVGEGTDIQYIDDLLTRIMDLGIKRLFLDPLYFFLASDKENLNASNAFQKVIKPLRVGLDDLDCSLMVIDHTNKHTSNLADKRDYSNVSMHDLQDNSKERYFRNFIMIKNRAIGVNDFSDGKLKLELSLEGQAIQGHGGRFAVDVKTFDPSETGSYEAASRYDVEKFQSWDKHREEIQKHAAELASLAEDFEKSEKDKAFEQGIVEGVERYILDMHMKGKDFNAPLVLSSNAFDTKFDGEWAEGRKGKGKRMLEAKRLLDEGKFEHEESGLPVFAHAGDSLTVLPEVVGVVLKKVASGEFRKYLDRSSRADKVAVKPESLAMQYGVSVESVLEWKDKFMDHNHEPSIMSMMHDLIPSPEQIAAIQLWRPIEKRK